MVGIVVKEIAVTVAISKYCIGINEVISGGELFLSTHNSNESCISRTCL